jgi:hypothetical protein
MCVGLMQTAVNEPVDRARTARDAAESKKAGSWFAGLRS